MLVKPVRGRAEHAARYPVDTYDLIAEAALVGSRAKMIGPHQRVAFRAQDHQHRAAAMEMRLMVTTHGPFGEVADQSVVRDLELSDRDSGALLLLSIDLRFARIGNEVRVPNPLTIVGRQVTLIAGFKVIMLCVVSIAKTKIAVKNKFLIVIVIQCHRCGRDRQKKRRLLAIINYPVQRIHWRRGKASGTPPKVLWRA